MSERLLDDPERIRQPEPSDFDDPARECERCGERMYICGGLFSGLCRDCNDDEPEEPDDE